MPRPTNETVVMNKIVTRLEAADIAAVLELLPHRYPFLMVDRVIDMRGDEHGIGIKNVTINEPHFQGHFPGNPVFPGVLMIEGMAQTAGVLCIAATGAKPASVFFLTIDKAKFRKPVRARATQLCRPGTYRFAKFCLVDGEKKHGTPAWRRSPRSEFILFVPSPQLSTRPRNAGFRKVPQKMRSLIVTFLMPMPCSSPRMSSTINHQKRIAMRQFFSPSQPPQSFVTILFMTTVSFVAPRHRGRPYVASQARSTAFISRNHCFNGLAGVPPQRAPACELSWTTLITAICAPSPIVNVGVQADTGAQHEGVVKCQTAKESSRLSNHNTMPPNAHVVADLDQIVDLGPLPDDCVAVCAAVDRPPAPISTPFWMITRPICGTLGCRPRARHEPKSVLSEILRQDE